MYMSPTLDGTVVIKSAAKGSMALGPYLVHPHPHGVSASCTALGHRLFVKGEEVPVTDQEIAAWQGS
jgi:hypothetical protein